MKTVRLFLLLGMLTGCAFANYETRVQLEPLNVVVRAESTQAVLPWETLPMRLVCENHTKRAVTLHNLALTGDVLLKDGSKEWRNRGACGILLRGQRFGFRVERPIQIKPGESADLGTRFLEPRHVRGEAGTHQVRFSAASAKDGAGQEFSLTIGTELVDFQISEPSGMDLDVWRNLKAVQEEKDCEVAFRESVRAYPESRYVPSILFYDLHDYAAFVERFPDHLLVPEAMMLAYRNTRKSDPGEKIQARQWLKRLRKEHPESDAAWYAGFVEEWEDLQQRVNAEGVTRATVQVMEQFNERLDGGWLKPIVEARIRGLQRHIEEHGEKPGPLPDPRTDKSWKKRK